MIEKGTDMHTYMYRKGVEERGKLKVMRYIQLMNTVSCLLTDCFMVCAGEGREKGFKGPFPTTNEVI